MPNSQVAIPVLLNPQTGYTVVGAAGDVTHTLNSTFAIGTSAYVIPKGTTASAAVTVQFNTAASSIPATAQIRGFQVVANAEWGSPAATGATGTPPYTWSLQFPEGQLLQGTGYLYGNSQLVGTQTTLSVATGTSPITTLSVVALALVGITSGDQIVVTSGATQQTFTASANKSIGATSVSITSATPTINFPIGSTVIDITPASQTIIQPDINAEGSVNTQFTSLGSLIWAGFATNVRQLLGSDWNTWGTAVASSKVVGGVYAASPYFLNMTPTYTYSGTYSATGNDIGAITGTLTFNTAIAGDALPTIGMFGGAELVVYYNQTPTLSNIVVIGQVEINTGPYYYVPSTTPVLTWTYIDPENDPQAMFRVVATNYATSLQVYDSGWINSAASSYAIPTGVLSSGVAYQLLVEVSDLGSSGRSSGFSTSQVIIPEVTYVNQPVFTPQWQFSSVPPPSFVGNLSSGVLGPMNVTSRLNQLSAVESNFTYSGSSSVAPTGWTVTGCTFATPASLDDYFSGPQGCEITLTSTTATFTCTPGGSVPIGMYAYGVSVWNLASSGTQTIEFFPASQTFVQTMPHSNTMPVRYFSFLYGADASITFTITGTIGNSFIISQPFITLGVMNLLDNASMAYQYLTTNILPSQQFPDGWYYTGYTMPVSPIGVNVGGDADENNAITGSSGIVVGAESQSLTLISHNAFYLGAGTWALSYTGNQSATLAIVGGSGVSGTPTGFTPPTSIENAGYLRYYSKLTTSSTTWGQFEIQCSIFTSLQNAQLEPIFTFANGTFSGFGASTPLPTAVFMGTGQFNWFADPTAAMNSGNTAVVGTASQIVSCANLTTVTFAAAMTSGSTGVKVTFFDTAYQVMYQLVGGSYAQSASATWTSGTVSLTANVPTGAVFCKVTVIGTATSATFSSTGTLTCSQFYDGGWSQGSSDQVPGAYLLRSPSVAAGYTSAVRSGTLPSYTPVPVTAGSPIATFYDAEYALDYDQPDTLATRPVYQAYTLFTTGQYATASVGSPPRSFYRYAFTDWWLINPTAPTAGVLLQVKTAKFSRTQNTQSYSGLGRSRMIVQNDVVQGDLITLDVLTFSYLDYSAFMAMEDNPGTLILRSPDGEEWYVNATKRDRTRTWTGTYARPLRTHNITLQEVDPLP